MVTPCRAPLASNIELRLHGIRVRTPQFIGKLRTPARDAHRPEPVFQQFSGIS
jgi:hypothetical protein